MRMPYLKPWRKSKGVKRGNFSSKYFLKYCKGGTHIKTCDLQEGVVETYFLIKNKGGTLNRFVSNC